MEGSMIDLSKYCFESAKDDLETAQLLIKDGRFKVCWMILIRNARTWIIL